MPSAQMSPVLHAPPRAKPSCLVVEDQVLIGLSLEAFLQDCGWEVSALLSSNAEALEWLAQRTPDLAIVDFALRDGPCTALAEALRASRVPFLIYSGRRPDPALPPALREAVWLEKPAPRERLLQAIEEARSPIEKGSGGRGLPK